MFWNPHWGPSPDVEQRFLKLMHPKLSNSWMKRVSFLMRPIVVSYWHTFWPLKIKSSAKSCHSGKEQLGQLSIVKYCVHVCLEPPGGECEHSHGEGHHAQLPNCHHHGDNGWWLTEDRQWDCGNNDILDIMKFEYWFSGHLL